MMQTQNFSEVFIVGLVFSALYYRIRDLDHVKVLSIGIWGTYILESLNFLFYFLNKSSIYTKKKTHSFE